MSGSEYGIPTSNPSAPASAIAVNISTVVAGSGRPAVRNGRRAVPPAARLAANMSRRVAALTTPERPVQTLLGEHLHREGQRLDHLANFYFQDPNGYWRIAELNEAMLPDALAEVEVLDIPTEL